MRRFPLGKILSGVMLSLLGTAIIAASGIVAAASFGLLTPFSILGFTFGLSVIVGGVSVGIGATIGSAAVMGSGHLFFKAAKKHSLRKAIHELKTSAAGYYGVKLS